MALAVCIRPAPSSCAKGWNTPRLLIPAKLSRTLALSCFICLACRVFGDEGRISAYSIASGETQTCVGMWET